MQIDANTIVRVYSGKEGCMCGCKGKWTSVDESARSVKIITGKLARNPNTQFDKLSNCFYITENGRTLAAYLTKD